MSAPLHGDLHAVPGCELCEQAGGKLLWRGASCRVVLVDEPGYAGYCRVIWNSHVREMTDLSAMKRQRCMDVVFGVERALRMALRPHKVNLASFGNAVPHIHWHVIPRFENDPHFPNPAWGIPARAAAGTTLAPVAALTAALDESLREYAGAVI